MRFSSSSSLSVTPSLKEGKGSNQLSPRLRKKHKRLDSICEKEYTRNHGDPHEGSGGVGAENNNNDDDVEIRRSSRVRRAPVVLDVSPPPRKKRKKFGNKNAGSSSGKKAKSSPVVRDSEGLESPGSWKSRLRSRGGKSSFRVNEEGGAPRGKRKLFEEIDEERGEEKVRGKESGGEKGEPEVGKYTVVKSKRPGRVKATNGSKCQEKVIGLDDVKDEGMEESGVAGDRGNGVELQSDNDLGGYTEREEVDGHETQLVEKERLQFEDGCICNDTTEAVDHLEATEHAGKAVKELDDGEDQNDVLEIVAPSENGTNFVAIEQIEKQVEQVDCEKNPKHTGNVASSANETESAGCHGGADDKRVELDEEPRVEANGVKVESSKCATRDTYSKPRIKEGRRCGLCGGGTDGKPPKPLAHDTVESENDLYSGSSGSEEPNYDIWDGFGDEAGWLGRLLGPINDRFGIAGTWVHQHCAVWSPEVYFAGLGCLKNVRAALCRGRALKCTRCGRPGATIGCRVDRCPKTYHLPCARANGCIFDHRKFLIACTDHRHIFQPYGVHNLARIKKVRLKKMKLELRKHSNETSRKDIEAEEKWFENCGEDEEFLKRESKRLHRDLARIAPVYIGGKDCEDGRSFQGWESVAGLQDVIQCMKEVVILPLLYPEFFDNLGLTPPRGILLHGYPGTGKTLVVRALIGACARGDKRIAYFARKGADCLGKYVGDAERQLRLLFQVAEKCQPSIIFFDEIDGLAPCRTRRQDQTHSSVVSTLLALMDGLKSRGSVIVIGATNRPDAIDPALRRPGRFDREIYFPLPSLKDRAAILSLHTQRWPKQVTGSLLQWIARKTAGFAGADLQALCTQAAITGLKRNFPLQKILSAAEKRASCDKLHPLPNFAVEERDWLEALSRCPPPCSHREAGIAANEVVSSSLPLYLIPCLLQPLATLLVSLHLEEHILLPAPLSKAAGMIKSVMVSTLVSRKLQSDNWWSFLEDFIREADVAEEIERNLLDSEILIGDDSITTSNDFGEESDDSNAKFKSCMKRNGKTHMHLSQHTSFPPRNKLGFRLLIAGNPRSGQRHLASCLVHCFVGNAEIQKVDLATISQEGHGDAVQGITQIFMRIASVSSCVVFMPRMDLWAVETPQQVIEESESLSTSHQFPGKDDSDIGHDHLAEKENISGLQKCKSAEKVEGQGVTCRTSNAWSLFLEQVESISVSTSLVILATSEVPYSTLPIEIRQFFKKNISNCSQLTLAEHTVPRFVVQVDGDFDHDSVIDTSAAKLARDVVQQLIQLIHHRSHTEKTSSEEYRTCDFIEEHASTVNHTAGLEAIRTQCNEEPTFKTALNKTGKGRSNLHLAISSFGYQILRYPHFAELCWFSSKLKEGPSAEVTGPWKGWPFNSCIICPSNSLEKISLGSSSGNVKNKEKPGLVRGLIAVGLSAYKGDYTSLREVSLEIRKVLELLVRQINSKVQAGKDRYQYVRLLSQVAYLEDKVNSWAYTLQSLELDAPVTVDSSKVNGPTAPDKLVQSEEGKPDSSSKRSSESEVPEEYPHGLADEKVECVDLNKEDGDFACPNSEGGVTTTDGSLQKVVPMDNIMPDIRVDNSEGSDQVVGDILNEQNCLRPEQSECENNGNNMLLERDSGCLEHSDGFACTESAVISEDCLGSGENGDVKCFSNQSVSSQIPGFPGDKVNKPRLDADENVKDASSLPNAEKNVKDVNFPSTEATESGDVCLYRCCSECLNTLRNVVKKVLIHQWELDKNHWTVDDVHDVVSSLSVDLVSTVRRVYDAGILGNPFGRKMRTDEKLSECREVRRTCHCNGSENGIVVLVDCSCHPKNLDTIREADTSLNYPQSAAETKFVFRDGVLVHIDPDKDVSFHCKIETLCLCHLIESIQTINQPSGESVDVISAHGNAWRSGI